MELFTSLTQQLAAVRQLVGEVPEASAIPEMVRRLSDDEVLAVLKAAATVMRSVERFQLAASGVVAERSTRASGHAGLAQSRGHRNPASLVQHITGATRAESAREVRVGESLLAAVGPDTTGLTAGSGAGGDTGTGGGTGTGNDTGTGGDAGLRAASSPWHEPLGTALLDGTLSSPQHDAIRQGLGEPPLPRPADELPEPIEQLAGQTLAEMQAWAEEAEAAAQASTAAIQEAWRLAAEELVREAKVRTVEELRQAARSVRDMLDPMGAEQRAQARYENRSFRLWLDAEGGYRGSFTFDDEAGAWVRHLIDAALRPRRGGPRFVDPAEKARAQELIDDPRTNEQLTHDLMIDVLRGGTLADATQVMGARQAGVRVVTVVDTDTDTDTDTSTSTSTSTSTNVGFSTDTDTGAGTEAGTSRSTKRSTSKDSPITFLEEDNIVVPHQVAQRQTCDSGIVPVTVDRRGNPLNVGREQRLFTSKQRIALSIRDGGCRWIDCDRVASYCEAHHIDEWAADQGRTDIDRGLLLCRFHHMQLHNGGWRITRNGDGPFVLHRPTGEALALPPRASRTTAWNFGALAPPAPRFFPAPPDNFAISEQILSATSAVSTAVPAAVPSAGSPPAPMHVCNSTSQAGPPPDRDRAADSRKTSRSQTPFTFPPDSSPPGTPLLSASPSDDSPPEDSPPEDSPREDTSRDDSTLNFQPPDRSKIPRSIEVPRGQRFWHPAAKNPPG